ncbi:hypothetical protein ACFC18_52805, partial [Streptomyces sp. NPDC056121]|uniref:hypothetical protein n=1 Tax=Streptomyces sp. NPDC056121 TaxID=3345718 RepID=UPI0035E2ECBC
GVTLLAKKMPPRIPMNGMVPSRYTGLMGRTSSCSRGRPREHAARPELRVWSMAEPYAGTRGWSGGTPPMHECIPTPGPAFKAPAEDEVCEPRNIRNVEVSFRYGEVNAPLSGMSMNPEQVN